MKETLSPSMPITRFVTIFLGFSGDRTRTMSPLPTLLNRIEIRSAKTRSPVKLKVGSILGPYTWKAPRNPLDESLNKEDGDEEERQHEECRVLTRAMVQRYLLVTWRKHRNLEISRVPSSASLTMLPICFRFLDPISRWRFCNAETGLGFRV